MYHRHVSFAYLIMKERKKERKKERNSIMTRKQAHIHRDITTIHLPPAIFLLESLSINDLYSRDQATEADISRLRKSI